MCLRQRRVITGCGCTVLENELMDAVFLQNRNMNFGQYGEKKEAKIKLMKWQIKLPEEYISEIRKRISVQEMRAFLITFLAGICFYIPMMVYRLNTGDGNLYGIINRASSEYATEDAAGRYLLKYAAHLKSMFVMSWLAVILGILFIAIGSILICRILYIRTTIGEIVTGLFIVLSPCVMETFTYYYVADVYLFCFPLVSYAVYLLYKKKTLLRMLSASGCLFVSLAFYQAYLFLATVLFLYVLLYDLMEDKKTWKEIGKGLLYQAGSGIIALIAYVAVEKALKIAGLIYYSKARFKMTDIFSFSVLPGALADGYRGFFQYFFTMDYINNNWKARNVVNGVCLLLGIILLIAAICKKKRTWQNKGSIIATLLLLPIAFMGIRILNWQEARASIIMLPTMPLFYIGIWALWNKHREQQGSIINLCGWGLYAVTFYLLVIMSVYVSIYQLCMKYYVDKTDSMAQRIIERIEKEYPETTTGSPVFICGDVDEGVYPQDYWITQASYIMRGTQACGGMFYNLPGVYVWNYYIRANFGVEYEMVSERADEIYASTFYGEMPLWPEKGCIQKTEDGILVVKLKP